MNEEITSGGRFDEVNRNKKQASLMNCFGINRSISRPTQASTKEKSGEIRQLLNEHSLALLYHFKEREI
jgi:hypothetical protein